MREAEYCSCGGSLTLCSGCVRASRKPSSLMRGCRWLATAAMRSVAWLFVPAGFGLATIGLVVFAVQIVVRPVFEVVVESASARASQAEPVSHEPFDCEHPVQPTPSVSQWLFELANAPHASSRYFAAQCLARMSDPTTGSQLLAAMPGANDGTRAGIVWVLGQRADGEAALACLLRVVLEDPSPRVRKQAIESLAAIGDSRAIPLLHSVRSRESRENPELANAAERAARWIENPSIAGMADVNLRRLP